MFYYISVSLYFYLKKKIKKLKYQRIVQSLASYFIYLCLCFYFREFKKLKLPKNRVIAKENSVLRFISLHLCFYYIYVFALYFSATPLLFSFRFFFFFCFLLSAITNICTLPCVLNISSKEKVSLAFKVCVIFLKRT